MISIVPRPFGEDVHPWRALVAFSEVKSAEMFEILLADESVDSELTMPIAFAVHTQMEINSKFEAETAI